MNKSKYSKTYNLTFNDFDKFRNIYPSTILNLFQDCGGDHASKMKIGFIDLIDQNLIWALLRIKYEVLKKPYVYQSVVVETWPLPVNKCIYQREFLIKDLDDNILIKASSLWTILDIKKRVIAPIKDIYSLLDDEYILDTNFNEKIKRIKTPTFSSIKSIFKVQYTDLDFNNHLNNSKYTNYILNSLNIEKSTEILTFQMDYHKEVLMNDTLVIQNEINEKTITSFGKNQNDEIVFISEMTIK